MNLNDIFQLIWPNRVRRTQIWSRISDEFWWDSGDCSLIILSSTLPWTEERNVCFQGQFNSELVVSQCNVCSVNLYALSHGQPFQHTVQQHYFNPSCTAPKLYIFIIHLYSSAYVDVLDPAGLVVCVCMISTVFNIFMCRSLSVQAH